MDFSVLKDRLRYVVFFAMLAISLITASFFGEDRWLFGWTTLSCSLLCMAYLCNRPELVCGKTMTGRISVVVTLLNLPWLLLTWGIWFLIALFNRESAVNLIVGTNISIARYPLWGVNLSRFSHIFDLTAEFPRLYRFTGHYECLPNLDGVALVQWNPISPFNKHDKILIHCAQGHGRSATFAALLLAQMGVFATPQQAYQAIIQSRTAAKLSDAQRLQLASFDQLV